VRMLFELDKPVSPLLFKYLTSVSSWIEIADLMVGYRKSSAPLAFYPLDWSN
jgi:hypothetical protein